jgi:hypothetical protein
MRWQVRMVVLANMALWVRLPARQQRGPDRLLDSSKVGGCKHWGFRALRLHSVPPSQLPPPPPSACFRGEEVVEAIVGFAENIDRPQDPRPRSNQGPVL